MGFVNADRPSICPVCHSTTFSLAFTSVDKRFDDRPGSDELYVIWRCGQCGLGVTSPPLSQPDQAAAYPDCYEPFVQSVQPSASRLRSALSDSVLKSVGYARPDAWSLPGFLSRVLFIVRCWSWCPPPPPPGRLLDVGCGSGVYGASLLRIGWHVHGLEPDKCAARRAQAAGLEVQANGLLEAELPEEAYNVVRLWHVLEHLPDPILALQHIRPCLRQGGLLMIEVPNWTGLGARLTNDYWFHLDLPRHRVHFTPTSLSLAVTQAGYVVQQIRHIPNPHGLAGAIAFRWGQRFRWNPAIQAVGWGFGLLAAALRKGDVIRIMASTPR